jgi:RNA recognition motif-containing protein
MTVSDLQAMFDRFGTVKSIHLVTDNLTGLSKCYGFVEMTDRGGADRAVASLNGKRVEGHFVVARTLF